MSQILAITPGEPAGIGPDVLIALAQNKRKVPWLVLCDAKMLAARAELLGIPLRIDRGESRPTCEAGSITVKHIPLAQPAQPGRLDVANAPGVLQTLATAAEGCLDGRYKGVVTGPVQKSIINDSGFAFSGHTEFFADACGVPEVVMLLVAGNLRVALATTHLPLSAVPAAITVPALMARLSILHRALTVQFRIPEPRILVSGLNPHAGESGHLGREEIEVIEPVCRELRAQGFDVVGPLPADTLFTPKLLSSAHAVFAMYHDQGLPVVKHAGFGSAVNVTLGLPFVRTSVDHGTALDIAGSGAADPGSFAQAAELAQWLAR